MRRGRGVYPLSRPGNSVGGEGAERSEAGEGACRAKDPHPAAGCRPRPPSPAVRERGFVHRVLRATTASSAVKCFVALALLALAFSMPAGAACTGQVADRGARLRLAAAGSEGVGLTFLGHASFLIESPQGVKIVTDYKDMIRAPMPRILRSA